MGGNMPCILNAANEIAVWAFLLQPDRVPGHDGHGGKDHAKLPFIEKPSLQQYF